MSNGGITTAGLGTDPAKPCKLRLCAFRRDVEAESSGVGPAALGGFKLPATSRRAARQFHLISYLIHICIAPFGGSVV